MEQRPIPAFHSNQSLASPAVLYGNSDADVLDHGRIDRLDFLAVSGATLNIREPKTVS